jgi:predicted MPP superfamily phosphohydrolase
VAIFGVVAFLVWVNLLPPLAQLLWRDRFSYPLDGGYRWRDGRPLFGLHKTLRGVIASVVGGTMAFPLLGASASWWLAGTAALLAMAGDFLSSFIKRRLDYPSGSPRVLLDQLLEGLFPTLFLAAYLPLMARQVFAVLLLFVPVTYMGSRLWSYALYRPPADNCLRIIRSRVRAREWRASHQPMARWQTWLYFEDYVYYRVFMTWLFRQVGWYARGLANALDVRLEGPTFWFAGLPPPFDGFRILLLTDLHLDGLDGLTEAVVERMADLEVDLCVVGGDLRMEMYGPTAPCLRRLRKLLSHVRARHGVVGVLGNHDSIEMVPDLEDAGIWMLINEARAIEQDGETIWVVGVDDPHFYRCHDLDLAFREVPEQAFRIFLAHTPELYAGVTRYSPQLYLCGHTHGGQICLPRWGPVFTHSSAPRWTAAGAWEYRGMQGYTSRGVGPSGIPLRFNCPAEVTLITLRRGSPPPRENGQGS